ncbi:uncharacterized, partial [Tachysurus ichikawai]
MQMYQSRDPIDWKRSVNVKAEALESQGGSILAPLPNELSPGRS